MDLLFLGTGAAEAIPAMFCRCDYCRRARESGGKDLRTRSSFRIDARHQIDMSPDCYQQSIANGVDFFELEHLLVTHSHDDHFAFMQILSRDCAVPQFRRPLYIYLHKTAARWATELALKYAGSSQALDFLLSEYRLVPLSYFQSFRAGDLEVETLKSNHRGYGEDEWGLNYLIRLADGRSLLYATDTGWYGDETWEFLSGKRADIVVLEATYGGRLDRGERPEDHLDARSSMAMLERMASTGFIGDSTRVFITHINHKHGLLHDELQREFDRGTVHATVAYDGLRIDG
jgi:phosphoribosyl 1,2-cyclic phosphate phosphodiesterase